MTNSIGHQNNNKLPLELPVSDLLKIYLKRALIYFCVVFILLLLLFILLLGMQYIMLHPIKINIKHFSAIAPFWGNFLVGLLGALLTQSLRVLGAFGLFKHKAHITKFNILYLIFYSSISLAAGFLTALIFRKANETLFIESLLVGMSLGQLIAYWFTKFLMLKDEQK